jgi:hypothetical protein
MSSFDETTQTVSGRPDEFVKKSTKMWANPFFVKINVYFAEEKNVDKKN